MNKVSDRVKKHRQQLRKSGLRPVQIWVPDTRLPHFKEECRRQSHLATAIQDKETNALLEGAMNELADSGDWE
ncbi:antitoxin MazE family protein [Photorhabdus sp. SF281]|uniref:antitoxin MazE family protein n=1 Tax=Photorhabdus sp. SF281 TaxID=3459527 RepID=UPI00404501EA